MHNPNISQRRRQIMLLLSYVIMTAVVLVISVICLMLILGYRFDVNSNRFEQGGLVQFRTVPSNATITFNDRRLNFTTPGKLNVSAGQHTVKYTRGGYLPWTKTVNIDAGELRWLNYARLVPEQIKTEAVIDLEGFADALTSPDKGFIAVLEDSDKSEVTIIDIRNSQQTTKRSIKLQDEAITSKKASYKLLQWDDNSRYLLLEQRVGNEKQFIRVDRTGTTNPALNISNVVRLNINAADFYKGSNSQVLIQTGGVLRVVNLSNQTIAAPLVDDVEDYSLVSKDELVFLAERDNRRVAGVYVDGKEIIVRTFDETGDIEMGMGTYYDERYLAVTHNNNLELIQSPESQEGDAGRNFVEVNLPFAPEGVSFSPTGRFVLATKGLEMFVYDLELEAENSFNFPGQAGSDTDNVSWLDSYYLGSTRNGRVVISEFDGHNKNEIASTINGSRVTFDSKGDYLYSFVKDGAKFKLQRSQMVID